MQPQTILDYPKNYDQLRNLQALIRAGAGIGDMVGYGTEQCVPLPHAPWMDAEEHVEEKHARILVPFVERYTSLAGCRLFDFGCGTGGVSVAFAARGALVTAVDPILANVSAVRVRAAVYGLEDRVESHHIPDTRELPYNDESFDLCVANSVFEYIYEDREQYIRELWRLVNPGGILFITDTSNGIYPMEMHTRRWWVNYRPRKARQQGCVRGLSYMEIMAALNGCSFTVLGEGPILPTLLEEFLYRHTATPSVHRRLALIPIAMIAAAGSSFGIPVSACLPWLNVALQKDR